MRRLLSLCFLLLAAACATNQSIVTNVNEREANEIVVFLASRGISATKVQMPVSNIGAANSTALLFSISVPEHQLTGAMALLNQYGLPRLKGTTLLALFAKSGLMSSDKEETVRYQAGVSEELKNTICKMDGVLDADVQVSYPSTENATPGAPAGKVTASVYVKHQGVLEDPNSHLEEKIKRLMAGSVPGLDYDSVSVISDRARLADIVLSPQRGEFIGGKSAAQPYAQIWSITMTEGSLSRFRWIFFSLISLVLLMGGVLGWVIYRAYPNLPFLKKKEPPSSEP
jgi:type III secretion protein J